MSLATIVAMMLTIAVLIEGTEMQENSSANVPEQHEDSAQEDPGIGKGLLYKAIERVAARRQKVWLGYYPKKFEDGDRTFLCVTVPRIVTETNCNRHKSHEKIRASLRRQNKILTSNDFSMFEWEEWNNSIVYYNGITWVDYFCCTTKPEQPEQQLPEQPEQPEQQLPERH